MSDVWCFQLKPGLLSGEGPNFSFLPFYHDISLQTHSSSLPFSPATHPTLTHRAGDQKPKAPSPPILAVARVFAATEREGWRGRKEEEEEEEEGDTKVKGMVVRIKRRGRDRRNLGGLGRH